MNDKTAWMKRFAQFHGRINQAVAEDIYEHGQAQEDREPTFSDMKANCVELGRMAFELYTAACTIEETVTAAYIMASTTEMETGRIIEDHDGQEE